MAASMDELELRVAALEEANKRMMKQLEEQYKLLLELRGGPSDPSSKRITMEVSQWNPNCVVVHGDTRPYRMELKKYKSRWNPDMKMWTLARDKWRDAYMGLQQFANNQGWGEDVVANKIE